MFTSSAHLCNLTTATTATAKTTIGNNYYLNAWPRELPEGPLSLLPAWREVG